MQKRTAPFDLDWEDLKAFLEVVRAGSARRAAQALGVHYTSVTRRMDALEREAGGRLLDRSQKGLSPTPLGLSVRRYAEEMESAAHALGRQISGADESVTGSLTLATTTTIAAFLLADEIASFCKSHPGLSLDVRTGYSFADVSRGEADVIIRASNNPGDHLVGRQLGKYYECAYATRAYLEQNSISQSLCVDWRTPEAARERLKNGPLRSIDRFMQVGDEILLLELTKSGFGIGVMPCFYGDVARDLVRVPGVEPWPMLGIWLLTHRDLVANARVRAFVDYFTLVLASKANRLAGSLRSPQSSGLISST